MKQKIFLIISLIIEVVCMCIALNIERDYFYFVDELFLSGGDYMYTWLLLLLLAVLIVMTFVKLILSFKK